MAFGERLELLISMDPSQAVSAVHTIAGETDRSLRAAESSLKRFATAGAKIGAGGFGVGAFLTSIGSAEQEATQQLDAALQQAGQSVFEYSRRIDEAVSAQNEFGHTESETKNALATLTISYGDAGQALDRMQLVADIAARKHISLGEAATLVARAHAGSARAFKQFGQEVITNADGTKNYEASLDSLANKLQGQASASANTFMGRLRAIGSELHDQAADIGATWGPAILGVSAGLTAVSSILAVVEKRRAASAITAAAEAAAMKAEAVAAAEASVALTANATAEVEVSTAALGTEAHLAAINALFRTEAVAAGEAAVATTGAANSSLLLKGGLLGVAAAAAAALGGMRDLGNQNNQAASDFAALGNNADFQGSAANLNPNDEVTREFFTALAEKAPESAQKLRDAMAGMGKDVSSIDPILQQAAASADGFSNSQKNLGDSTDQTSSSLKDQAQAARELEQSHMQAVDSVRSLYDAERAEQNAQAGIVSARRAVADATDRVTDAQRALNKALAGATEEDLGKASLDISDAHNAEGDSAKALADEQARLDKMRAKGIATADELAAEERKVAELRNRHQRDVFAVTDAEQRLQDLQKKGTDQDEDVIAAKKNLSDAEQNLVDAKDRVSDALLAENDAALKLKKAQEELGGRTQTANQALSDQIGYLSALAGTLDPNSAQGKAINDYLDKLLQLQGYLTASGNHGQATGSLGGPGSAPSFGGLPGFASGGIVPGPYGMPRLAVVHGGEQVLTPSQQIGGVSVNISQIVRDDIAEQAARGTKRALILSRR